LSSDNQRGTHNITATSDFKQIPSVDETGSDGSQRRTSTSGDLNPPITQNRMPDGEFVGSVKRIVDSRSRGISGSDTSMLVLAKMRELEGANRALLEKLDQATAETNVLRDELYTKNLDLEVERTQHANAISQRRITAIVLVVAGILVSAAFSTGSDAMSANAYLMLGLGILLYLVGIFLPAIYKKPARS